MSSFVGDIFGGIVEIGASGVSGVAALAPLLGGLASGLAADFLDRRMTAVTELLIDELRRGEIPVDYVVPPDHALAVLLRIQRAALEGSARLNLRLMAQVISGKIVQRDLRASEFLHYASILSDLRRPEIALLGSVLQCEMADPAMKGDQQKTAIAVKTALISQPYFPDEESVEMYCSSVVRHGLLIEPAGDKRLAWGSFPILPSSVLRDLATLIDIERAIKTERPDD